MKNKLIGSLLDIVTQRPLIPCAVFSFFISVALAIDFSVIYIVFITLLFLAFCCIKYIKCKELLAIVIILFLVTFKSLVSYGKVAVINSYEDEKISVGGVVSSTDYYGDANVYEIEINESSIKRFNGTKATFFLNSRALSVGDSVQIYGTVNIHDEQNKFYYYSNGVFSDISCEKVDANRNKNNFHKSAEKVRTNIRNIIFNNTSYDTAATLNALLIGDKAYLSAEYDDAVRKSGVSHMLVVSGMHMVIICGSVLKVLSIILLSRRLASFLTLIVGISFMSICGFTPSVMRAGIMYMVMLSAAFLLKRSDSLNSLCFSVIILIFVNPFITQNAGFLLSVFATAGIILLSEPIANIFTKQIKSKFLISVISVVSVTLAATITTLPILIFCFKEISLVAVFTNLLISSTINIALILAILGVAAFYLPHGETLCKPIFMASELAVKYSNAVICWLGNLKYAYVDLQPIFDFFQRIGV